MSKNNKEALLYLLPAAVLFLVFYYWPLLQNIYLSVFSWNMISPNQKFVGLENFITIFKSVDFHTTLKNTFIYSFCMVAILMVMATLIAVWV
ncbi:carbohydrate ABC transporter permease, partial [Phascolarctobacterium succinatutens]|uniref:carbohydrate ABC transporter permease n=1 Tax=Phascolarctobacterium succinatutens TaxID=626940 RepID=UPI00352A943C